MVGTDAILRRGCKAKRDKNASVSTSDLTRFWDEITIAWVWMYYKKGDLQLK